MAAACVTVDAIGFSKKLAMHPWTAVKPRDSLRALDTHAVAAEMHARRRTVRVSRAQMTQRILRLSGEDRRS